MKRSQIYEFGSFRLDTANHSLSLEGSPVAVKPKSLDVLLFLLENRGRVVGKDEMMEKIWQDAFVEESNITQTIYELRRALGETARRPRFIENVPKRGYRFVGEVSRPDIDVSPSEIRIGSLAVLPFSSLRSADRDEALELGIADTLINGLSILRGLVVRPTSSVRRFADSDTNPAEIGRTLGVDAVLHGTIQRSDKRLRVTARLIEIESEIALWSGHFDERAADIFLIQDSLLEKISSALSLKLSGVELNRLKKRDTEDTEAHSLFLKCRYHWYKWTADDWKKSIDYGERVTRIDPAHAPALAWTAASYCNLGIVGILPPREAFEKAISLVEASLDLEPAGSKANEIRAAIKLFYEWDWHGLPAVLAHAIDVSPNNSTLLHLRALHSVILGDFADAAAQMRSALGLDPLSLITNTDLGYVYFFGRRYHDAIEQFLKSLELDRYFSHARHGLGYAYLTVGELEKGVESMRQGVDYRGTAAHLSPELGYALALAGDDGGAEKVITSLKRRAENSYVDPYHFALIYSGLRDKAQTLRYLEDAFANRSRELMYIVINPVFEWLRTDVEFTTIVEKVGLPRLKTAQ